MSGERREKKEEKEKKRKREKRESVWVFKPEYISFSGFLKQNFVFTRIDSCFQFLVKTTQIKASSSNFELASSIKFEITN